MLSLASPRLARHSPRTVKAVSITLALWLGGLMGVAPALAASALPEVSLYGTKYLRVDDWARANGFQPQWRVRDKELRLTRGAQSLVFFANSQRITLDGVELWLTRTVARARGSFYVSPVDFVSTIQPLLSPAKNARGRLVRTIVLDPGHGGKDPGNREGRQFEKRYTLLLAEELSAILRQAGFNVSLTRTSDTFVDLPTRPEMARRRGADLFLSLHFNSADGPGGRSVQGCEVYALTPARAASTNARGDGASAGASPGNVFDAKNVLLAYHIQKSITRGLGVEDRGVKRARFAVLRTAEMPAVLIEAGFMTHPVESKRIYDGPSRRRLAQAIADGVIAYKRLVEDDKPPAAR